MPVKVFKQRFHFLIRNIPGGTQEREQKVRLPESWTASVCANEDFHHIVFSVDLRTIDTVELQIRYPFVYLKGLGNKVHVLLDLFLFGFGKPPTGLFLDLLPELPVRF